MILIVAGKSRGKSGMSCTSPVLLVRCSVTIVADNRRSSNGSSNSCNRGNTSGGSSWSFLILVFPARRAEPMRWMRNDEDGTMAGGACTEAAHETLVEAVINNKTLRFVEGL
ncbi:hypothetical protein P5V15_003726 [Pogonomyrmex californicus]